MTMADGLTYPMSCCPAYTVLWTNDYCRGLRRAGDVGKPLRVLFGGSHLSQPSLTSYGVRPGDWVYPIRVDKGRLYVVAGMQVQRILSVEEYLAGFLNLPGSITALPLFELEPRLRKEYPSWGHLLPWGCLTEVAIGLEGASIQLDRAVPVEVVERLRFVSRRGERPIRHLEDGLIKSTLSLQGGTYRLSDPSARDFAALLAATP